MIREVENSLHKLKYIKEEGRKTTIEAIKEIGKPTADISSVDRYLNTLQLDHKTWILQA
jgi:hypothetical protein